jgi:hypothetical protein
VELAVEVEDWLCDLLVGIVAQIIARDAAEARSKSGRQRIPIGHCRLREGHRHKEHVRRNEEDGAFDEGDAGKPCLCRGSYRLP